MFEFTADQLFQFTTATTCSVASSYWMVPCVVGRVKLTKDDKEKEKVKVKKKKRKEDDLVSLNAQWCRM